MLVNFALVPGGMAAMYLSQVHRAVSLHRVVPIELFYRNAMRPNCGEILLISGLALLLPVVLLAQNDKPSRILVVDGQSGHAPVIEQNGRAYVDLEALTEITHGFLSFKADRIILTLPASSGSHSPMAEAPAEPAHSPIAESGLSRDFMLAGIEEIATIREWARTLAYAIENGYPITEHWAAQSREQAAHDLRLAAAAVSSDSDRNALQLLTNEFEAVRDWSNKLVQERKTMDTAKYAVSDSALRDDPRSQKIITCGHFLATMLGSGSFKDDPSCH